MRNVTYACDLCREEKKMTEVKTIYWKSFPSPAKFELVRTNYDNVIDRQICDKCIEMIKNYEQNEEV